MVITHTFVGQPLSFGTIVRVGKSVASETLLDTNIVALEDVRKDI